MQKKHILSHILYYVLTPVVYLLFFYIASLFLDLSGESDNLGAVMAVTYAVLFFLKYSMKNTRVFITASQKNGSVVMEFKNVSAYPLDFDVEEITQRFVRGDESRTTEGNGLGLAIAKSYTEICNGSFEIATDGDLFKAILKFRKYNQ